RRTQLHQQDHHGCVGEKINMDITTDSEIKLSREEFLDLTLLKASMSHHQLAVWRKPQEQTINILIDHTGKTKRVPVELEALAPGFILHPFADQPDQKVYYLEASEHIQVDLRQERIALEKLPQGAQLYSNTRELKSQIRQLLADQASPVQTTDNLKSTSKEEFLDQVEKGIRAIQAGELSKIVPAKRKLIPLSDNFDLVESFLKLCEAYPNAFVNFIHVPGQGSWIGASPEILIKTKGDQFATMALAGSQKA